MIIWMAAAALCRGRATAGLMWFSTASSAQFRVEGGALSVSGQLTLASTERLDRLLEEHRADDAGSGRYRWPTAMRRRCCKRAC
jgi:hypothetical protein